jgi:hypothetical protein
VRFTFRCLGRSPRLLAPLFVSRSDYVDEGAVQARGGDDGGLLGRVHGPRPQEVGGGGG